MNPSEIPVNAYCLICAWLFVYCISVQAAYLEGDVKLGGLFVIHLENSEGQCTDLDLRGLGRAQAMFFAVEKINNDSNVLPMNVTLGSDIRDYCGNVSKATRITNDLFREPSTCNKTDETSKPIVALIGPKESSTALAIGGLLQVFGISGISGTTTSPELSSQAYEKTLRDEIYMQNLSGRVWFLSEGQDTEVNFFLDPGYLVLDGSIGLPPRNFSDAGFREYVKYLNQANSENRSHGWLGEYWALRETNCFLNEDSDVNVQQQDAISLCSRDIVELIYTSYVPYIIDAVYAVANAIQIFMQDTKCHQNACNINKQVVQRFLPKVNFIGLTGRIKFDEHGDPAETLFNIVNFRRVQESSVKQLKQVVVGKWQFVLCYTKPVNEWRIGRNSDTVTLNKADDADTEIEEIANKEYETVHGRILAVNMAHLRKKRQIAENGSLGENAFRKIEEANGANISEFYQGDIDLDPELEEYVQSGGHSRNAIRARKRLWTSRIIPYRIPSYMSHITTNVQKAISEFHSKTCVRFVNYIGGYHKNYIEFGNRKGCSSKVGKYYAQPGRQLLSIGNGCNHVGTIIHELMHALGFFHEQSRIDRDKYVKIYWENILKGFSSQFDKYSWETIDDLGVSYDYQSIMHYDRKAFTKNGKPTIVAIGNENMEFRNPDFKLSTRDALEINALYDCKTTSYGWATWSGWTPCDGNCYRTRERFCYNSGNLQSCGGNVNAYGVETQKQKCPSNICPAESFRDMADLGSIKRQIGARKRHVVLNIDTAKEIKQRPIDGDLEIILDETRDKRDQLQQHLRVYESLRTQLEDAAKAVGKREYEKVMEDYEEYSNLAFEAEQLVVGLSWDFRRNWT
ncbi:hypothetical protein ACROYT_G030897 [Oculina patagonica]